MNPIQNQSRSQWLAEFFPKGVPSLWCPPLTHYTSSGAIDRARIAAHLRFLAPWTKGLLVPGTTGDGWELTPEETSELMDLMFAEAPRLGMRLLWGALHPDATQALRLLKAGVDILTQRQLTQSPAKALLKSGVCGFAVCPPRGPNLSQTEMERALADFLEVGLPIALYQLPQITGNEISPALAAHLACRFSNLVLFKDSSGIDRVASSGLDLGGVFLVRGMEGGYARWLKTAGGRYDGFLLGSANSFGRELNEIRQLIEQGCFEEAQALSSRLSSLIETLFDIVATVPTGNKFTNANKLADHFFAFGPKAASLPPPRLHSGTGLTAAMVRATEKALEDHRLKPARGYLE
jgi:dihydrodipicolinate synthase/N-acetylneuraminate lyase